MKVSRANHDNLYTNVINTIIQLMNDNNVKVIPMSKDKTFGKKYVDLHLTGKDQLAYHWKIGDKLQESIFKSIEEQPNWDWIIHRFDLAPLLQSVVVWLNDNITEEI